MINLKRRAQQYKEVLQNTISYRKTWGDGFRDFIKAQLEALVQAIELQATVEVRADVENLGAVVLNLGDVKSGMYQHLGADIERHLIKHNGSLIYQQLFNGKIIVLIQYPYIENYGQPRPPHTVAIYRPEELQEPFFIRHVDEFLSEIMKWEDFDDDEPNKRIGFNFNFGPGMPIGPDGQEGAGGQNIDE
jgi:hypothetical protein